jgi:hypothetical protein
VNDSIDQFNEEHFIPQLQRIMDRSHAPTELPDPIIEMLYQMSRLLIVLFRRERTRSDQIINLSNNLVRLTQNVERLTTQLISLTKRIVFFTIIVVLVGGGVPILLQFMNRRMPFIKGNAPLMERTAPQNKDKNPSAQAEQEKPNVKKPKKFADTVNAIPHK